ncbi:MAG: septum formation inhibitor Maf [Cyanobacteria bacterium K_Offshore_surface_m2_239]|nr:septum formation inhibitor Maf [Cyanobacteria bacterium K_Offshore_surface_m2_239]
MLLLASASPARRRLLEQAAIPHRVRVSGVAEEEVVDPDPVRLVRRLARAKAEAVHGALTEADGEIGAVLGCDSVLVVAGEVHGKPLDAADAIQRWRRMAGGWGELHTGHCLLPCPAPTPQAPPGRSGAERASDGLAERPWLTTVTTRVRFAALDEAEIVAYVETGEPLRCAGAFALEGRGGLVVEEIAGCFSNVIGLSLPLLRRWLRALEPEPAPGPPTPPEARPNPPEARPEAR